MASESRFGAGHINHEGAFVRVPLEAWDLVELRWRKLWRKLGVDELFFLENQRRAEWANPSYPVRQEVA